MTGGFVSFSEVRGLAEFQKWAKDFAQQVPPKSIILLRGELGVGKTEFVKNFVEARVQKTAVSPTFSLHHHYEDIAAGCAVDHWDLYRLEGEDELESSGFWDQFAESQKIVLVEWAEKVDQKFLPLGWNQIRILLRMSSSSKDARIIEIS